MLRVSELHWWEGRHPQCWTTFSSIAGAQHQPLKEKEDRSHKTPALLQCQGFCLRRLAALRKCKWNASRYHNDVHCTYCKHRTKQSISVIESPLHSCWDKITIKNRKGGFLDARGGVPIPLEPSPGHAPDLFPAHRCPSVIKFKIRLEYASVNRSNVLLISKAYFPAKKMNWL